MSMEMNKANECTCPSGDGSLRWPCPAHPAEQAGGDERVIGWRERILAAHPNSDPGFWPDALLVEHMAAEIADLRAALAQPSPDAPYADGIAADLERSNWTPEEALRWYAQGNHFDAVGGRTRIIDTGAIASNALKHLSLTYLEMKGDAELTEMREANAQPSPAQADEKPGDSILCYGCFAKGVGPDHFDEAGKCLAAQAEQAEAERPEMSSERAAYFMRRFKSEEKLLGPNEQAAVDYVLSLIAQHERIVGDLQRQKHEADTALAWATRHYQTVEQERDAALARVAELTATRNRYGVDAHYFNKNLQRILRDFESFTPDELARSLIILAKVADEKVVAQAQHSVPELDQLYSMLGAESQVDAAKKIAELIGCRMSRSALTEAQMRRIYENSTEIENERLGFAAFARLMRRAEAVHQIAAAPGKEVGHE